MPAEPEPTAAQLFETVWSTLAEVIGTAATATLLRRSARRAAARGAKLEGLHFERRSFEYTYALPSAWTSGSEEAVAALRAVASELQSMLRDLTGPVLVRRLAANRELQTLNLFHLSETK